MGRSTPVEARAGSTAAKMARLTVLAPLTAVLEKPTRRAAEARAANSQPDMCQSVIVFMRGPLLCAANGACKYRLAGWHPAVGWPLLGAAAPRPPAFGLNGLVLKRRTG